MPSMSGVSRPIILGCCVLFASMQLSAEDQQYRVLAGNTLYSIARSFHIAPSVLQSYNHITDPSRIVVGQILLIPSSDSQAPAGGDSQATQATGVPTTSTPSSPGTPAVQDAAQTYTVVRGDTLYAIARKFKITVTRIQQLNDLKPNSILRPGDILIVVPATNAVADNTPAQTTPAKVERNTVVKITPSDTTTGGINDTLLAEDSQPYAGGETLLWPHEGARFSMKGKLPGVRIKAVQGDTVRAVQSGRVYWVAPYESLGRLVVVINNDYYYMYAGLSTISVTTGTEIHAGDPLGTVGAMVGSADAWVFFSVYRKGIYLDPSKAPRDAVKVSAK